VKRALAPLLFGACLLAGCDRFGNNPDAQATAVPKDIAANSAAPAAETQYGTPVKDRVATLGLLNKRNNISQDLVLKTGEAKRVGNVIVKLATCERTLPWETPPETGAFVQVFVEDRNKPSDPLTWRQVFSGWLFKNSPSLNVVEHPVYDVWVKDCAMKFPGEEEEPPAAVSSASNASGSASAAPSPSAAPSDKPSPRPSPSPTRRPAADDTGAVTRE
jgi:hypothetical protein